MTSSPRTRAAAAVAPLSAALLVLSLTGCTSVGDLLQQEASHEFPTRADLAAEWGKDAPWVPADATAISTRESTAGDPASLIAVSAADLDPAQCAEVDRESAPIFALEGTPDIYKTDHVFACGSWAVVATDDGWYGWTPNDPDEQAQSPKS